MEKVLEFRTPLQKWLWITGLTQTEFAKMLGCSRQRMSQLVRGEVGCGKKTASKIAELTGGQVSEMDLLFPKRSPSNLIVKIEVDTCQ